VLKDVEMKYSYSSRLITATDRKFLGRHLKNRKVAVSCDGIMKGEQESEAKSGERFEQFEVQYSRCGFSPKESVARLAKS
jgi:hypothetical protein